MHLLREREEGDDNASASTPSFSRGQPKRHDLFYLLNPDSTDEAVASGLPSDFIEPLPFQDLFTLDENNNLLDSLFNIADWSAFDGTGNETGGWWTFN